MGMSDDLEAAVAAGSTMVRVGRALFGDRRPAESSTTRVSVEALSREARHGASRHYAVAGQEKACHPRS